MKKSFILTCASAVTFFGCSWIVSAQGPVASVKTGFGSLKDLIETFTNSVLAAVGTLLLSMGVVAFFYGIVMYIWGSREGNETKIKNGNTFLKWSLLALFVMFSIYGIIKLAQNTLGLTDVNTITVPEIKFGKPSTSGGGGGTGTGSGANAGNNSGGPLGGGSQQTSECIGLDRLNCGALTACAWSYDACAPK